MRLAIIVPSDDLYKLGTQCQDLIPPIEPEKVIGEHPVLAIANFWTVMSKEPR